MARRTTKVRSRRSSGSRGRSTGRVARRSVRATSTRRSSSRKRAAPQTRKIVIEFAGSAPVRSGEPVSIGQKVAPRPRVRPRM